LECKGKMGLYDLLTACKELVRTGWMLRGVPHPIGETVAEHSWEAAVIAYVIASEMREGGATVDPDHAAALALFHDILEGLTGDLPRYSSEAIGPARRSLEVMALKDACLYGAEKLYREWMEGLSVEARVARLADYLSTYLQARRYLAAGYPGVEEILHSTRMEIERLSELLGLEDIVGRIVKNIV